MPNISEIHITDLTAGGGTVNLPVTDRYTKYRIESTGTVTLSSSWTIQASGTPVDGTTYELEYTASLVLGVNTVTFFGLAMPSNLAQANYRVVAVYNGTTWDVVYLLDGASIDIINTNNIEDAAVTYAKMQLAVGQGAIMVGDAAKQWSSLSPGTAGQLLVMVTGSTNGWVSMNTDATMDAAGAVTIANDAITTVKILDAQVTNAKLDDMAANTVKVRDANSSGVPSDKAVADTQILIGDGTGFTAASLSGDATMTNAGVVSVSSATSSTAAGITSGLVKIQVVDSATLKAKLDGTVNDLFAVGAGDTIIEARIVVQTPHAGASTIDLGPDATVRAAGADGDGFIVDANSAAAANYLSTNDTYTGALLDFGYFVADASGNITVQSDIDISAGAFVGAAILTYIPA